MAKLYDEQTMMGVRQALEEIVLEWPDVTHRLLFGLPAYRAKGTVFAALLTGSLALTRLNEEQRATLAEQYPVQPFQAGSKIVDKWALVSITDSLQLEAYLPYLEASYRNAVNEEKV